MLDKEHKCKNNKNQIILTKEEEKKNITCNTNFDATKLFLYILLLFILLTKWEFFKAIL